MKITAVECFVLLVPDFRADACSSAQDNIVVKIHTDSGHVGIGETDTNPWVAKAMIEAPGDRDAPPRQRGKAIIVRAQGDSGLREAGLALQTGEKAPLHIRRQTILLRRIDRALLPLALREPARKRCGHLQIHALHRMIIRHVRQDIAPLLLQRERFLQ